MSDELQTLADQLASEEPEEREDAAQQLAELKDPKAASYLHHALDDEADGVRMWGAYGLSLLGRSQDQELLRKAAAEDSAPLVRLWANFGLAARKDPAGAKALVGALDDPSLEVRSNAADAMVSLDDASAVEPLLQERLRAKDPRVRAWASGVLHALEHKGALEHWRQSLLHPESRVDAALVAPFLQSQSAARDLLRLLGELAPDELDEVARGSDLPLAEILSRPLIELGFEELLEQAQEDAGLRGEVLLVLLRGPAADPDVISLLHEFANELEPATLGADVATLLGEQEAAAHALLLARVATTVPEAVVPAVTALESATREQLFDLIEQTMKKGGDQSFELMPLLDLLRESPFGEQLADVPDLPEMPEPDPEMTNPDLPAFDPDAPSDEEFPEQFPELDDDITPLIERMVAGEEVSEDERKRAEEFLSEMGVTGEEFLEQLNAEPGEDEAPPPSASEVAQRALALGAMLRRAELEKKVASGALPRPDAQKQVHSLKKWMDEAMLLEVLTLMEADLIDTRTGAWSEDDVALTEASAEALLMLLYALGKLKAPSVEEPAAIAALLKVLPLGQSPAGFVEQAELRDPEELGRVGELWETWAWRVQQEDQARAVILDPEVPLDVDVDALVAEIKHEGFDDRAASAKGKGHRAAEALRFLSRKAAERLVQDKLLAKTAAGDFPFKGKAVAQLDDESLDALRRIVNERARSLSWVTSGGSWDDLEGQYEDFGEDLG